MDRLVYKIECIPALAGAGGQHGPDALAPRSALFAASALGNIAIYNNKPYHDIEAFDISNRCGQTRPDQLAFFDVRRQWGIMKLLTVFAPVAKPGMLGDAPNMELFFFVSQILPLHLSTRLLSDKFGDLLEKNIDIPP